MHEHIPHACRRSIHALKRINCIRCFPVQPKKQVKKIAPMTLDMLQFVLIGYLQNC